MTDLRAARDTEATDGAAGRPVGDPALRRAVLEDMLIARRASERLWNLQRQGRIATIPPLTGQEAAAVGVVRALDLQHDWLVPYYRELLGMAALGDDFLTQIVLYWRGHPDGGDFPEHARCLPPQISLGSQIPHAAGIAWGLKLQGLPGVACTWSGDGATSEGDFAEGLNLAGVQRVPLLVFVINNGWAISTPTTRQTAAATFAAKADAAGIPASRVDGNDALAVWQAARDARARAVAGDGPSLVELVTYRMGAHTNSDDPSRYVPESELVRWRARDPIERLRAVMADADGWDDTAHQELVVAVEARLERVIDAALARPVDPLGAFQHRSAHDDARLARQRGELASRLAAEPSRGEASAASDGSGATETAEPEDISWAP
ncbi:MAG TPA: thiamine pyrophosphate-dependent enzyme [Acidimicrobiia bacterium]|jgi:pyruvate dehydrogenase E1 component alpha subunit